MRPPAYLPAGALQLEYQSDYGGLWVCLGTPLPRMQLRERWAELLAEVSRPVTIRVRVLKGVQSDIVYGPTILPADPRLPPMLPRFDPIV